MVKAAALFTLLVLAQEAQAGSDNIGVTAAVRNDVKGELAGAQQTLSVGSSVYQDQRVVTGADAMAQLLFLDQTSLNIGPKSEVKLDRFVYDPARSQGDVVIEASRGAFRFVTGAQNPKSYTLKTPVATIGVRGTIVDFFVQDGNLIVILDEGKSFITMLDGTVLELSKPGDALIIKADGSVIGPKAWDGAIDKVVKVTTFPLYGHYFASVPFSDDSAPFEDYSNLTDELATHQIFSIFANDGGPGGGGSSGGSVASGGGFGGGGGHPNNGRGNGGGDGVPGNSGDNGGHGDDTE